MNENWFALLVSIFKCCSVEASFEYLRTGVVRRNWNDVYYFTCLKKNRTYEQVAMITGVSKSEAFCIIKRLPRRLTKKKVG